MPLLFASTAALSAVDTTTYTNYALAETTDENILWLLNKASAATVGANALAANPAGRWLAAGGAGPRYVDVDVDFGAGDTSKTVEVGATWVTATTSLRWSVQEATSTKNPEEAMIEGFRVAFSAIQAGVGFTLIGQTDSLSLGVFRVRVTGDRT